MVFNIVFFKSMFSKIKSLFKDRKNEAHSSKESEAENRRPIVSIDTNCYIIYHKPSPPIDKQTEQMIDRENVNFCKEYVKVGWDKWEKHNMKVICKYIK